ncbi:MAG TPA: tetratricopeptide repeat protein [Chitinispirillaceae bacterium]|nr:tetratricopeptide repeat protein [Chitinispirillaceae bacterium]
MNIKHNKHKQEMREDPVMDWILNAKDSIVKNQIKVIGAAVVVIVLFGAAMTIKQVGAANQKKALSSFGAAMISYQDKNYEKAIEQFSATVKSYASTPQAVFGSYLLGTIYSEQKKYQEAIDWYKKAVTSKKAAQFVNGQALEGIAACYENLGNNDEAIKYLEDALKDARVEHRFAAIKWKIALLSSSKNVEKTKQLCKEIMADTAAQELHQKAENLLTVSQNKTAG